MYALLLKIQELRKMTMSCLDIMLMLQAWPSARKFQGYFNGFKGSVSGKSAILVLETTYKNRRHVMVWKPKEFHYVKGNTYPLQHCILATL